MIINQILSKIKIYNKVKKKNHIPIPPTNGVLLFFLYSLNNLETDFALQKKFLEIKYLK